MYFVFGETVYNSNVSYLAEIPHGLQGLMALLIALVELISTLFRQLCLIKRNRYSVCDVW